MKLLLTSAGISNKSIEKAFFDLVGKPRKEIKVAYIPTAANAETGDKWWMIEDLITLKNMELGQIDIVDISAMPKKMMLGRLKEANVFFYEGGNTYHLMYWLEKTGLKELLPELLKTRVWIGVSAGSIAAGEKLSTFDERLYDEEIGEYKRNDGLGFVDFSIRPHLNNPDFPNATTEKVQNMTKNLETKLYFLDDQSAIVVDGNDIKIVSEGKWEKFE